MNHNARVTNWNIRRVNRAQRNVRKNARNIADNTRAINNINSNVAKNNEMLSHALSHASSNTKAISQVASQAQANTNSIHIMSGLIDANTRGVATNANAIKNLGSIVGQNSEAIAGLTANMAMLSGSVASNTAQIAGLTAQVAVLSEVAAPTVALANMMGVSVSTVSSLALAGSFAGPLIGVMALLYTAWPAEESDPWLKMESRVAQLVNDKFDEERRKRLTNRLKQYLKEFSRCANGWSKQAMPSNKTLRSMLQVAIKNATGEDLEMDGDDLEGHSASNSPNEGTPPCMAQLAGHMSLERDEWLTTNADSLSSLVMPFTNIHTQLLEMLADYSPADDLQAWDAQASQTSAEYANFILDAILKAWKAHVCRTVRLRYSLKRYTLGLSNYWKYQLVVLTPVWQPHAAEECLEKCGGKSGWCNYCGGRNVGACCIQGGTDSDPPQDPSECKQFEAPFSNIIPYSPYHACMHADCFQSNTRYYADSELPVGDKYDPRLESTDPTHCQESCQTVPGAASFTFDPSEDIPCICYGGNATLARYYRKGSTSGPTVCQSSSSYASSQTEEAKGEAPQVPMEQIFPCTKSPRVQTVEELETTFKQWTEECYLNASKATVAEFNPFYKRFATYVERLAIQAGCGNFAVDTTLNQTARPLAEWKDAEWTNVSNPDDFYEGGSFSECDWKREEEHNDGRWIHDAEKKQGITGLSRIDMDEQRKLNKRFPLPAWLQRLLNFKHCLDFASGSDEAGNGEKAAVENMILEGDLDYSE